MNARGMYIHLWKFGGGGSFKKLSEEAANAFKKYCKDNRWLVAVGYVFTINRILIFHRSLHVPSNFAENSLTSDEKRKISAIHSLRDNDRYNEHLSTCWCELSKTQSGQYSHHIRAELATVLFYRGDVKDALQMMEQVILYVLP